MSRRSARRRVGAASTLALGALTAMLLGGTAQAADGAHGGEIVAASPHPSAGDHAAAGSAASDVADVSNSGAGEMVRRAGETARAGDQPDEHGAGLSAMVEEEPGPGPDASTVLAAPDHDGGGDDARGTAGMDKSDGEDVGDDVSGHAAADSDTVGHDAGEPNDHAPPHETMAEPAHEAAPSDAGPQAAGHPAVAAHGDAEQADEPAGVTIAGESEKPRDPDEAWLDRRGPMPFEIVRSLQFLQDQVARGNGPAIRVQSILLMRYGPTFRDADAKVWEDARNLRAAALFVLSGGPPTVLRTILSKVNLTGANRTLFEGALAFVENRSAEAEHALASLDLTFVEAGLAAQINLVVAQLQQHTRPREALDRLKQVTLAAPGTLLDEAALRMGVMIAESSGERALSDRFARQYFDRFSGSAYAGNFRARFAAVYALRPAGTEDDTMATIADATATIPSTEQLGIYLAVARRALVEGNLTLAAMASERALTFTDAPKPDRQRALLYEIASTLTTRDFTETRAMLDAIDPKALHPADVKLRDAAFDVLAQMRRPLLADAAMASLEKTGPAEAAPAAVLARGNALLDAVNDDLKRASR